MKTEVKIKVKLEWKLKWKLRWKLWFKWKWELFKWSTYWKWKHILKMKAHFENESKFWKWKQILKMKAHFENESTFWKWKHILKMKVQSCCIIIGSQIFHSISECNFNLRSLCSRQAAALGYYYKSIACFHARPLFSLTSMQ